LKEIIEAETQKPQGMGENDRERRLLDKVDELEEQKRKLINDIQDYKNDLKTLVNLLDISKLIFGNRRKIFKKTRKFMRNVWRNSK